MIDLHMVELDIKNKKTLFKYVWDTRQHLCEVCGRFIKEAETCCFAHKVDISWSKKHKFNPNNIALVCWCFHWCHNDVDKICKGKRYLIEQVLDNWGIPTIDDIKNM